MNDKEYLTVKEFAETAGITQQAVYKQLKHRLSRFATKVNGQQVISRKALEEFYSDDELCNFSTESLTTFNPNSTQNNPVEQPKNETTDRMNEQLITMLQNELEQKNKQIADLNERLAESNKLINQEQQLRLFEQNKYLELETKYNEDTEKYRKQQEEQEQARNKNIFSKFIDRMKKKNYNDDNN